MKNSRFNENSHDPSSGFLINMRRRAGSTMVEVIIAAVILVLAILGYSSSYVQGRKYIFKQRRYQSAVHFTAQKMEEIRALGYSDIDVGQTEENIELFGLVGVRQVEVELTDTPSALLPQPCKKVTVTTTWTGLADDPHEIVLVTYIGP